MNKQDKVSEWRQALFATDTMNHNGSKMEGGPLADLYNFLAANTDVINRLAATTEQ